MNQKSFSSILLIGVVLILLSIGGYFVFSKKLLVSNQGQTSSYESLVLTWTPGDKPFVQINFDWSRANRFNLYRSTNVDGEMKKIMSDISASAHTLVDYDIPKGATKLYYKIAAVDDQGKEISVSNVASVELNAISDWKTYSNSQYGFEVKYPESYFVSGNNNGSNITFKSEACKSLVSGGGGWPTDCQSYNVLIQQNKISGPEMSKIFVAGIQAEKFSDSDGQWSNSTQVLVQFQEGQNWYIQTFTFNTEKSQVSENIMDQILSTFKFTK